MNRRRVGVLGLGIGIVLVACSGSSSSGPGASTPDGACDQYVSTLCNKIAECFPFAITAAYKDANECIARQKSQCVKSLEAPSTGASPSNVSACATAISAAVCDDVFKQPEACRTPAGSLADGAACSDDAQCQGRSCNKSGDTDCGACAKRIPAGGDCSTGKCDDGLTCASNQKCVAAAAAGASCGETQPCQTPLVCSKGTCAQGGAAGAACSNEEPCNTLKGLGCDPTSNTCKEVKFAKPGETCGLIDGTFVGCAASGDCKLATGTPSGTCQAALADGATCGGDGPRCQEPAECRNGVCTIPDPAACK